MRWAGHVIHLWGDRGTYRVLVGKIEGKRSLGKPSCRRLNVIEIDLKAIEWDNVDFIAVAQDRGN
jgi:hypothetical protein